ncbi:MAG: hypothetical protein UH654_10575 [Lachnospiraceae bacterium]|nr:hypothetical protein [Lachnospiraceae bacterium]
MSSKTRLYVIKSKELIYTTLFVVVALVLVILMVCMFLPDKNNKKSSNKNTNPTISNLQSETTSDITSPTIPNMQSETVTDITSPSVSNVQSEATSEVFSYTPGIYSSDIILGGYYVNLSLTIDNDRIKSVELKNLTEAVSTMYPLIEPAMSDIEKELLSSGSIKKLSYSGDNQYTYSILADTVNSLLDQAVNLVKP